ncbi:MAG: hypothetical protein V1913_09405 [Fibrobacterota bacterium]
MMERLKNPWLAAGLMAVAAILLGFAVFQAELNTNGDNGSYISYARSLAAGKGLTLASHPLHLKSDKFPILYPLFLAFWIKFFGYHLFLLKVAMLGIFALGMALFLFIARRSFSGLLLLGLCALTATNYWLLDNATITMSEPFFMLFLLGAYLAFQRYEEHGRSTDLLLAIGCVLLTPFIRTIGIAPALALFAWLAFKRKWRWLAGCGAAYALFYLVNRGFMAPGGYGSILFLADPYNPEMGTIGLPDLFRRIIDNALFYSENTVQMTLFSFLGDQARFDRTSVLLFTVLFVVVFFALPLREILRRPGALFLRLLVLLYLGILLTWPMVWSGPRFVVPIIPFLLLILFENGHFWITRFVTPDLLPRLKKAACAVCLLWSVLNFSAIYQKTHTPLTSDWTDFYRLAEWSKSALPDSAVVCARSPFLFYLKSNRMSVPIPFTLDRNKAFNHLKENRAGYVVIDHFQWTGSTQVYLAPLLEEFKDRFELVKTLGSAALYRVKE